MSAPGQWIGRRYGFTGHYGLGAGGIGIPGNSDRRTEARSAKWLVGDSGRSRTGPGVVPPVSPPSPEQIVSLPGPLPVRRAYGQVAFPALAFAARSECAVTTMWQPALVRVTVLLAASSRGTEKSSWTKM
jgi:hypothetical protein